MNNKMINNLILDMGGVILDVDYTMIFKGFSALGVKGLETFFTQQEQLPLVDKFEIGAISPEQFRQGVKDLTHIDITDEKIDQLWNSMVNEVRKDDILLLNELRKKYNKIFLFSNTNEIHVEYVKKLFFDTMGFDVFATLFDKVYFSNEIHARKPDVASFDLVCQDAQIDKQESLFIDDTQKNIDGARLCGLNALLLGKDQTLTQLYKEGII